MIIDDLYRFNAWANAPILKLCADLTDSQLDEPREMGFGSLRNTVFHILTAEEIWFERWTGVPWRPFTTDAAGLSIGEIEQRLERVGAARQELIDRERANAWSRICDYKDSRGNAYSDRLDETLLHVANHGTYHRAQALNYLKHLGRTVPGGLDYLFFRFANPAIPQEPATVAMMQKFGLEVATGSSPPADWEPELIRKYFAYGDWCNALLLDLAAPLDAGALDRDYGMGLGTLRKTALHIADAERWWLKNWTVGSSPFEKAPVTTTIAELREQWTRLSAERNQFLATLDATGAHRLVTAQIGPMSFRISIIESLLQLCGHGTHHRAQLINMLRQNAIKAPATDYVVWHRQKVPAPSN